MGMDDLSTPLPKQRGNPLKDGVQSGHSTHTAEVAAGGLSTLALLTAAGHTCETRSWPLPWSHLMPPCNLRPRWLTRGKEKQLISQRKGTCGRGFLEEVALGVEGWGE